MELIISCTNKNSLELIPFEITLYDKRCNKIITKKTNYFKINLNKNKIYKIKILVKQYIIEKNIYLNNNIKINYIIPQSLKQFILKDNLGIEIERGIIYLWPKAMKFK